MDRLKVRFLPDGQFHKYAFAQRLVFSRQANFIRSREQGLRVEFSRVAGRRAGNGAGMHDLPQRVEPRGRGQRVAGTGRQQLPGEAVGLSSRRHSGAVP